MPLKTDDSFISVFPPESGPPRPRQVLGALTSKVQPERFENAFLVLDASYFLGQFGLSRQELFELMAGKAKLLPEVFNFWAWATRYGGHQFGHWAGQLGDGRAMTLGFPVDQGGFAWEWQLKGSGPTPYSRMGDGYAVMRSSYREFVASEALHALHVPTTRALGLMATGQWVTRDFFYDGNPKQEVGAVCLRVAPSFLRFGHFQILQATKEKELLQKLFDFVHQKYFTQEGLSHPGLLLFEKNHSTLDQSAFGQNHFHGGVDIRDPDRVLKIFSMIGERTLETIVQWWRVGFTHGVMNTDNMSIHGLTIDYGPFGWLSSLDLQFTPNTTDFREHRYAFGNQPAIALWNLAQLASSFTLLDPRPEEFEKILTQLEAHFEAKFLEMMNLKMGLPPHSHSKSLVQKVLQFLHFSKFDYTLFWRAWSHWVTYLMTQSRDSIDPAPWLTSLERFRYGSLSSEAERQRLERDFFDLVSDYLSIREQHLQHFDQSTSMSPLNTEPDKMVLHKMVLQSFKQNPIFIPRNHLLYLGAQELEICGTRWIDSNSIQESPLAQKIFNESLDPYSVRDWERSYFVYGREIPEDSELFSKVPEWGLKTPGCSQLSCSS